MPYFYVLCDTQMYDQSSIHKTLEANTQKYSTSWHDKEVYTTRHKLLGHLQ